MMSEEDKYLVIILELGTVIKGILMGLLIDLRLAIFIFLYGICTVFGSNEIQKLKSEEQGEN